MFVIVLSAPVNLEHRNSPAFHNIKFPLPPTGLTCRRSTYSAVSLTTVRVCLQQTDTKSNEVCRTAVATYQCLFFVHVSQQQTHAIPQFVILLTLLHTSVLLSFTVSSASNIWKHTHTHRVHLLKTRAVLFKNLPVNVNLNSCTEPWESA